MRNVAVFSLCLCSCMAVVWADYSNPPGWESDPYFTHQSWSFGTATFPGAPIEADPGYLNGSGVPLLTLQGATWLDDMGMMLHPETFDPLGVRQGGWQIDGPQDDTTWFSVEIPNVANPRMQKEVWFEITFRVSSMQLASTIVDQVSLRCYADGIMDGEHEFSYFGQEGGRIGIDEQMQIWLRFEGRFAYDPQPGWELLLLTGTLLDGQSVALDQIDIDTHCIPEPATLGLLAFGALGLLRRRR